MIARIDTTKFAKDVLHRWPHEIPTEQFLELFFSHIEKEKTAKVPEPDWAKDD